MNKFNEQQTNVIEYLKSVGGSAAWRDLPKIHKNSLFGLVKRGVLTVDYTQVFGGQVFTLTNHVS